MQECVRVPAPAKINLGLHVLPLRDDKFHEIRGIFTTVDLYDEIEVSPSPEKNTCFVQCEGMNLPLENTFTKAYKAFCVLTGNDRGVCVNVKKHIPSGGGLGGGSSDASSFIQSIDILFGSHLTPEQKFFLSGKVGSDVFFFTHALLEKTGNRYAAVVSGRGEAVRQITAREDFFTVLVFPETPVSTKNAYELVDAEKEKSSVLSHKELEDMFYCSPCKWKFVNDFTRPVVRVFPKVGEALADIGNCEGVDFCDMSGSGSTVFAVFSSKEKAERALKKLSIKWKTALV